MLLPIIGVLGLVALAFVVVGGLLAVIVPLLPVVLAGFLIVALAQIITIIGYGEYFPWAIPGVYAQGGDLTGVSLAIVILTSIAGVVGPLLWWEYADHPH